MAPCRVGPVILDCTLRRMRDGVRRISRLLKHPAYRRMGARLTSLTDAELSHDGELDRWIVRNLASGAHTAGTCKMAPSSDATAVVDPRVHGVEGISGWREFLWLMGCHTHVSHWELDHRERRGNRTPTDMPAHPACQSAHLAGSLCSTLQSCTTREKAMTTKVIQWATGAVGSTTLKAIIEHPDLELVGVWVHTPEKVGKDAGELAGLQQTTGVLATNDRDALIALDADIVVHTPAGQGPIEERDRDVFDLLRSGKNVVSSTGPYFVPETRSPEYAQLIEDACREGGTTLMSAGANPDVVVPWLAAALTRMSLDVEHIYLAEIDDFSPNPNLNMMVELLGLGKPAEEFEPWMEEGGYFQQSVLEWLHLLGKHTGVELGKVEGSYELYLATRDFEIPVGPIKKGMVCGAAFKWSAPRLGETKPFVDFEFIYTVQRDHPDFPGLPEEVRCVVEIEGSPSSRTTVDLAPSLDPNVSERDASLPQGVFAAAAASVFNCIPVVMEAPPGLFTMPVPGAWQSHSTK